MAKGQLERGEGGLGSRVGANAMLGVDGVDDGVPTWVADEVKAGEDDDLRDGLGEGGLASTVNATGRWTGKTVEGGDDGGRGRRRGGVERRDGEERGWERQHDTGGGANGGGGRNGGRGRCRAANDLLEGRKGRARREVKSLACGAARVVAAEVGGPVVRWRCARVVAVVGEAVTAEAGREAVVGEVS